MPETILARRERLFPIPPSKKSRIIIKVEATTLNERCLRLRPQDKFLRDNLSSSDVLIVSIGGNDIALAPTPCTIASVAGLLCLPLSCLENGKSFGAVPVSECTPHRIVSIVPQKLRF